MNYLDIEPAIYVGTYGKYNSASLAGEWVTLSDFASKEAFYEYCTNELHGDERDPELMFQDYEAPIRGLISESWVSEKVWELLELDEYEQEKVYLYMEATGADIDEALERYEDMLYFHEDSAYEYMEMLYPAVKQIYEQNIPFVRVDVEAFKRSFTRVDMGDETYYVDTSF